MHAGIFLNPLFLHEDWGRRGSEGWLVGVAWTGNRGVSRLDPDCWHKGHEKSLWVMNGRLTFSVRPRGMKGVCD